MTARLTPEPTYVPPPEPQSNGLGLASFVISLVGLASGGLLSIVGMILGAVAMRRTPRGFAIAGFMLGLFGTLVGCVFAAVLMGIIGVAGMGLGIGLLSLIHAQIEEGLSRVDRAAVEIAAWSARHDDALPDAATGTAVLRAAGLASSYAPIDDDEFQITLIVDPDSRDPWTFTGDYEADGDRTRLKWRSESGDARGNWSF